MHELVLSIGEASDRANRQFAQLGIELGFVAKLATDLTEAAQQVWCMRECAEDVADSAAALGGEVVEDDAGGLGKVLAIQVGDARRHVSISLIGSSCQTT